VTAAARILDEPERTLDDLLRVLPDLTTSAGPPEALDPPLSPVECKYLMGEATDEEAREAMSLFDRRAEASPDGEFWTCGVPDDDDA
jgi:hypothetical protein